MVAFWKGCVESGVFWTNCVCNNIYRRTIYDIFRSRELPCARHLGNRATCTAYLLQKGLLTFGGNPKSLCVAPCATCQCFASGRIRAFPEAISGSTPAPSGEGGGDSSLSASHTRPPQSLPQYLPPDFLPHSPPPPPHAHLTLCLGSTSSSSSAACPPHSPRHPRSTPHALPHAVGRSGGPCRYVPGEVVRVVCTLFVFCTYVGRLAYARRSAASCRSHIHSPQV